MYIIPAYVLLKYILLSSYLWLRSFQRKFLDAETLE